MNLSHPLLLILLVLIGYTVQAQLKLTVVKHYKVAKAEQGHADTLLSNYTVDTAKQKVDIFFCNEHFQVPHVLPTDGLKSSPAKLKECDLKNAPEKAKCYIYNNDGLVQEMRVGGVGYNSVWKYHYNKKGLLARIEHEEETYFITYRKDGNIEEVTNESDHVKKVLEFSYE